MSAQGAVFPRTVSRIGDEELQAVAIHVGEDVELTFMITDDRSPYALTIDLFVTHKLELVVGKDVRPAIEAIAGQFPVHKILGMENDQSGRTMHRGASQIIVFPHTDAVGVGEFVVEQRVGIGTISIVCCPCLHLSIHRSCHQEQGEKKKVCFHIVCVNIRILTWASAHPDCLW